MPVSKNKTFKKNDNHIIKNQPGNYEKYPFFIKKANEAKELLKAVGLPKKSRKFIVWQMCTQSSNGVMI